MSYRQVSQEYGDNDSDEEGYELGNHRTSTGPRHLGPATALDVLSTNAPSTNSMTFKVGAFFVGLICVYFWGVHEGKVSPVVVGESGSGGTGDDPFKTFHQGTPSPTPPPTPAPLDASVAKFTLEKLKATRTATEKFMTELESYYTSADQTKNMLLNAWTDPWDFDDTSDSSPNALRVNKLVDTMARALVTDDQDTFLMGGIGSSVMAGHDNCQYDSYENQMMRNFGGIWEEAGMKFVFQNAGEGGGCGDRWVFCFAGQYPLGFCFLYCFALPLM